MTTQNEEKLLRNKVVWVCCHPLTPAPISFQKNKKIILGRHKGCDLPLPHSSVSRNHAIIKVISGRCLLIEDNGSSNGTYVNGKKITAHPLELGDTIQIGPYEIEIKEKPFEDVDNPQYGITNTAFTTPNSVASMAGQIEKTPLVEILQSIEFNSKTGTLYVESKGSDDDGFFVFVSGRPTSAIYGDLTDIPALIKMLKLRAGTFVLTDNVEPLSSNISCSITNILFEFSRVQDEEAK